MGLRLRRYIFPFTAIVGQDRMKRALILNAINPRIGGVLIRGQKGTGKSTAVRALADLLPEIKVVKGCSFNCNPEDPNEMCDSCYEKYVAGENLPYITRKIRIVTLPLNATIDRVVGTLDIERALKEGIRALQPGLLAEAHRGILYIDEVNLLDDYIVDVLLDVAASGINIVEREGISVSHPSRFILVGTMNPEEGELRPQLLDRFGLQVEVEPITDPEMQIEIVKRVEHFESDPEGFIRIFEKKQKELREKIIRARKLLPKVQISEDLLLGVAKICAEFSVSNRAIIVISKTAKTIAAFEGRTNVTKEDIVEAIELALPHRMRKLPFEKPSLQKEELERIYEELLEDRNEAIQTQRSDSTRKSDYKVFDIDKSAKANFFIDNLKAQLVNRAGRRYRSRGINSRGSYIDSRIPIGDPKDIAFDATIRASILRQLSEKHNNGKLKITIRSEDLREKIKSFRVPSLILLLVDASGSMAALKRMMLAKGIAFSILQDAYIRRDRVSFIAFQGNEASILLPPTNNIDLAVEKLRRLPTGGKTPLSAALYQAIRLIRIEKKKNKNIRPMLILITDGKANVPLGTNIKQEISELGAAIADLGVETIIIDTSQNSFTPTHIPILIRAMKAKHVKLTRNSLSKVLQANREPFLDNNQRSILKKFNI